MLPQFHVEVSLPFISCLTRHYTLLFEAMLIISIFLLSHSICSQVDNAADNKNRWMVGFFAWMIELGWVEEVTVSMMEVGHTHEDIDSVFRQIVQKWQDRRKVLTPSGFLALLQVIKTLAT